MLNLALRAFQLLQKLLNVDLVTEFLNQSENVEFHEVLSPVNHLFGLFWENPDQFDRFLKGLANLLGGSAQNLGFWERELGPFLD